MSDWNTRYPDWPDWMTKKHISETRAHEVAHQVAIHAGQAAVQQGVSPSEIAELISTAYLSAYQKIEQWSPERMAAADDAKRNQP